MASNTDDKLRSIEQERLEVDTLMDSILTDLVRLKAAQTIRYITVTLDAAIERLRSKKAMP